MPHPSISPTASIDSLDEPQNTSSHHNHEAYLLGNQREVQHDRNRQISPIYDYHHPSDSILQHRIMSQNFPQAPSSSDAKGTQHQYSQNFPPPAEPSSQFPQSANGHGFDANPQSQRDTETAHTPYQAEYGHGAQYRVEYAYPTGPTAYSNPNVPVHGSAEQPSTPGVAGTHNQQPQAIPGAAHAPGSYISYVPYGMAQPPSFPTPAGATAATMMNSPPQQNTEGVNPYYQTYPNVGGYYYQVPHQQQAVASSAPTAENQSQQPQPVIQYIGAPMYPQGAYYYPAPQPTYYYAASNPPTYAYPYQEGMYAPTQNVQYVTPPLINYQPPPPPVIKINDNDVLCGRGGATNSHPGNRSFRNLVKQYKDKYIKAKKKEKPDVAAEVVDIVRKLDPPGRFLKKDPNTLYWVDIGDLKAKEKTSQALREGAPEIRKKLSSEAAAEDAEDDSEDEAASPDKSMASAESKGKSNNPSPTIDLGSSAMLIDHHHQHSDMDKKPSPPEETKRQDISEPNTDAPVALPSPKVGQQKQASGNEEDEENLVSRSFSPSILTKRKLSRVDMTGLSEQDKSVYDNFFDPPRANFRQDDSGSSETGSKS